MHQENYYDKRMETGHLKPSQQIERQESGKTG